MHLKLEKNEQKKWCKYRWKELFFYLLFFLGNKEYFFCYDAKYLKAFYLERVQCVLPRL